MPIDNIISIRYWKKRSQVFENEANLELTSLLAPVVDWLRRLV